MLETNGEAIARVLGHHHDATGFEAPPDADLFRVDMEELVLISVEDDQLVIDRWSAGQGRQVTRRD